MVMGRRSLLTGREGDDEVVSARRVAVHHHERARLARRDVERATLLWTAEVRPAREAAGDALRGLIEPDVEIRITRRRTFADHLDLEARSRRHGEGPVHLLLALRHPLIVECLRLRPARRRPRRG